MTGPQYLAVQSDETRDRVIKLNAECETRVKGEESGIPGLPDQSFLMLFRQALDSQFALTGIGMGRDCFLVYQCNRSPAPNIFGAKLVIPIVLPDAAFHIPGNAGVQAVIGTANNIDKPGSHQWVKSFSYPVSRQSIIYSGKAGIVG